MLFEAARQEITMRNIFAKAALLALAFSLPLSAHAEVTEKSDAGFVTSASAEVAGKTPMQVWQALIAPQKWWNKLHSWSGDSANMFLDAQAGGCFCELLPLDKAAPEGVRRGSVEHARVISAMPGKMLRMSGGFGPLQAEAMQGVLTVQLKANKQGTTISWIYIIGGYMRIKPDDIAPMVDKVMGEQLTRLAEFAANEPDVGSAGKDKELPDAPKPHQ
jgi:hypothetical protein